MHYTPSIDRSLNPHQRPSSRRAALQDGVWHAWRHEENRWVRLAPGALIFATESEAAEAARHMPGSDSPPWRDAPQPFAVVP